MAKYTLKRRRFKKKRGTLKRKLAKRKIYRRKKFFRKKRSVPRALMPSECYRKFDYCFQYRPSTLNFGGGPVWYPFSKVLRVNSLYDIDWSVGGTQPDGKLKNIINNY